MDLSVILYVSVLLVSFYFLIQSSNYLVKSSSILGFRIGISRLVIGLTIVAIGTSLPEMLTALTGLFTGSRNPSFLLGTVFGSNIANIFLIFGFLLFLVGKTKFKVDKKDMFFLILTILVSLYIVYTSKITLMFSLFLLTLFILYLYLTLSDGQDEFLKEESSQTGDKQLVKLKSSFLVVILVLSITLLTIGARGIVFSIENLGVILGIPLSVLTLSTVAIGTSLPELVVTYSAVKNKEFELGAGNIIGSNIANILFIVGVSGVMSSVFSSSIFFSGSEYFSTLFFLIFSTIIFLAFLFKKELFTRHGIYLIGLYVFYLFWLFFSF